MIISPFKGRRLIVLFWISSWQSKIDSSVLWTTLHFAYWIVAKGISFLIIAHNLELHF